MTCPVCGMPREEGRDCSWCPPVPDLPYAGSSGWSGSDTSRERAERADADGTTSRRQREVLSALGAAGHRGLIVHEAGQRLNLHHGEISGPLSVLHMRGRIARLAERRNGCEVYVLPQYVDGRETKGHGRKRPTLTDDERAAAEWLADYAAVNGGSAGPRIETVLTALERLS